MQPRLTKRICKALCILDSSHILYPKTLRTGKEKLEKPITEKTKWEILLSRTGIRAVSVPRQRWVVHILKEIGNPGRVHLHSSHHFSTWVAKSRRATARGISFNFHLFHVLFSCDCAATRVAVCFCSQWKFRPSKLPDDSAQKYPMLSEDIYGGNELSGVLLRGWGHSTITSLHIHWSCTRTHYFLSNCRVWHLDRRRDSTSKGSKRTLFILPAPGRCSLKKKKRSARDLYDTHCDEKEKSVGEWNRRNIFLFIFFKRRQRWD